MHYQTASDDDVHAIVALLKQSLGESLMPKSGEYWRWKHQQSPFGESPVLLCWDGSQLAGVRAFMRWQWQHPDGQIMKAVRAVDTATHPDYQGKGIFKKLTLDLVAVCRQQGDDFVFNTPNNQSKPGYLKMGWEDAGRMPVRLKPVRPLSMLMKAIVKEQTETIRTQTNIAEVLGHAGLKDLIENGQQLRKGVHTFITVDYLTWRYLQVPVADYWSAHLESDGRLDGVVIGRVKTSRFGKEFRITDCFVRPQQDVGLLKKKFSRLLRDLDINYVTFSAVDQESIRRIVSGLSLQVKGPSVTIRSLGKENLSELKNFSHWSPALGDMELF